MDRNVGLFKYWKVSNIPLFIIAGPMLCVLLISGFAYIDNTTNDSKIETEVRTPEHDIRAVRMKSEPSKTQIGSASNSDIRVLRRLVLPQLMMAILALTTFHVQIVNRISSGYPIWYYYVASKFVPGNRRGSPMLPEVFERKGVHAALVRMMIMYALIQGVLFAAFLPPA
jgi:phosphatidylinositol glycan class V